MSTQAKTLAWGKPTIQICALRPDGQPTGAWKTFPVAVQDTTKLNPQKGEKYEAKTEGGGIEAVRYGATTYELEYEIRYGKGDTPTIEDRDGIIEGTYALRLQPENKTVPGLRVDACTLSAELNYDAKDGTRIKYTASVLQAPAGNAVKLEIINLSATNSLIVTLIGADGAGAWRLAGEPNWRASGEAAFIEGTGAKTIEYKPVDGKTAPATSAETTVTVKAGENAIVAAYK